MSLADDAVAVCCDGDGFRAFATPWNMDLEELDRARAAREGLQLAAVCFLHQSPFNGTMALAPNLAAAKALAEIIPGLQWFSLPQARHLLDLSVRLCQQVPGFDLHFTRDGDLWRTLQECGEMAA